MTGQDAELAVIAERMNGRLEIIQFQLNQIQSNAAGFAGKVDVGQIKDDVDKLRADFDAVRPSIMEMIKAHNENHETKLGAWRGVIAVVVGGLLMLLGAALTAYLGLPS